MLVTWFAIRLVIVFGIIFCWALWQVDFVMAYPQAPVEMVIYMELPQGIKMLEEEVPTELKLLLTLSCTLTSLSKHTTEDPAPGCLSRRRIPKMIYFRL